MHRDVIIEKFVPPNFSLKNLDLIALSNLTNRDWQLASSGTSSLLRILANFPPRSKVLIPSFICGSVVRAVTKANCDIIFYDIDPLDLNGSVASARECIEKHHPKALVIASLFGNPADLHAFESLAKEKGVFLIDDSAQSFGAKLEGQLLGTFGDAGLISFSPGKATAGHLGSFFWSKNKALEGGNENYFLSWLKFWDFYFNRLNVYRYRKWRWFFRPLSLLNTLISKSLSFLYMMPNRHDQQVMGGIIDEVLSGRLQWRQSWIEKFNSMLSTKKSLYPVRSLRGTPNNFKVVLVCQTADGRDVLVKKLETSGVYVSHSYRPHLTEQTPVSTKLNGMILELPVENSAEKMNHLFNLLSSVA